MNSALYYPFTGPQQHSFLKTAMFLWDSVDFIVPHRGFYRSGMQKSEIEALELIGREYVPTLEDQKHAHTELEEICTSSLGDRFLFELEASDLPYNFYPQKLLNETWQMLADSKLAKLVQQDRAVSHVTTGPLFGYYMMTILAICCGGNRKRLITDQSDPYRALANLLGDDCENETDPVDWHSKLISLSFAGPDFSKIPLERLTTLRKKEDALMLETRQNFLKSVDEAARDISKNSDNENVVKEIIFEFTRSMELDLKELKRALRRSATSLILSKEFGFSVITATTAVTVAPVAGILTAGTLSKGLMDYQDRRRNLLKSHPSSWLFSATGPRIPVA